MWIYCSILIHVMTIGDLVVSHLGLEQIVNLGALVGILPIIYISPCACVQIFV